MHMYEDANESRQSKRSPCRISLRFFISNQNLCTFIYDIASHPAHAVERSKLMEPFLQTEFLLQLWFIHAEDTISSSPSTSSATSTSHVSYLETAALLIYLCGLWHALLIICGRRVLNSLFAVLLFVLPLSIYSHFTS